MYTKSFLFLTVIFFIISFLIVDAIAEENNITQLPEYVSVDDISHICELTPSFDMLTNRVILESNDKEIQTKIVIAPGIDFILIDNESIPLRERVTYFRGKLRIEKDIVNRIQEKIDKKRKSVVVTTIPIVPQKAKKLTKVIIDPGHGGKFPGATANGIIEADINLSVAFKLKKYLENAGIKVIMTREKNVHLSEDLNEDLDARVNLTNREKPDIFVSIHVNASNDNSATGFEVFVAPVDEDVDRRIAKAIREEPIRKEEFQMSGNLPRELSFDIRRMCMEEWYKQSRLLADSIINEMGKKLPEPDRGVKEEGFRVIKWTRCPAVLVEIGFLTNRATARRLLQDSYRNSVANAIAQGILAFKKKYDATEGFTKSK
ncbi:MAG: N-acetylmuramoyl-L-alanine amidase [Planctomycetota bacterium]